MNHWIKKIQSLVLFTILSLFMSCSSVDVRSVPVDSPIVKEPNIQQAPMIAFITCLVSKEADEKISISLKDVIRVEGKLKPQDDHIAKNIGNYEFIHNIFSRNRSTLFELSILMIPMVVSGMNTCWVAIGRS